MNKILKDYSSILLEQHNLKAKAGAYCYWIEIYRVTISEEIQRN